MVSIRGLLEVQHGDEKTVHLHQDIVTALLEEAASRRDSGDNLLSLPDLAQFLRQCQACGLSVAQPDSNGIAFPPLLSIGVLLAVLLDKPWSMHGQ